MYNTFLFSFLTVVISSERFNFLLTFVCSICFVRVSYPYLSGELRTVHNPFSGYLWETVSKIQSREYQNCKVLVQLSVR